MDVFKKPYSPCLSQICRLYWATLNMVRKLHEPKKFKQLHEPKTLALDSRSQYKQALNVKQARMYHVVLTTRVVLH